uniref:Uncharacterized protein n=1 Tax=Lepeophtheirus salmonis TaxID=72036 RepID=A0A0K2UJL6_LEPSM
MTLFHGSMHSCILVSISLVTRSLIAKVDNIVEKNACKEKGGGNIHMVSLFKILM